MGIIGQVNVPHVCKEPTIWLWLRTGTVWQCDICEWRYELVKVYGTRFWKEISNEEWQNRRLD